MKLAKLFTDFLGFVFFLAVLYFGYKLLTSFSEYDICHIANMTFDTIVHLIKRVLYM